MSENTSRKIVDIVGLDRFYTNLKSYISGLLSTKQDSITDLDDDKLSELRESLGVPSTEYIISVFEELKDLISANKPDEAIAVLDQAILDLHKLQ